MDYAVAWMWFLGWIWQGILLANAGPLLCFILSGMVYMIKPLRRWLEHRFAPESRVRFWCLWRMPNWQRYLGRKAVMVAVSIAVIWVANSCHTSLANQLASDEQWEYEVVDYNPPHQLVYLDKDGRYVILPTHGDEDYERRIIQSNDAKDYRHPQRDYMTVSQVHTFWKFPKITSYQFQY